jgi:phospholipid transport system substrate-binding protein
MREERHLNPRSKRFRLGSTAPLLLLLLASHADAAEPTALGPPSPEAAKVVIETLHAAMLGVMKQGVQLGYAGRLAKLQPAIFAAYDFEFIAEKSVGLAWKDLDAEQQGKLVDVIGRLAAATYAARMADFSGERFETVSTEPASQDTILVHTRIVPATGAPVPLDYRLRNTAAGPRVVDVFYDGTVSELAMRRSEYSALLKKGGIQALLDALEKKTAEQATAKAP